MCKQINRLWIKEIKMAANDSPIGDRHRPLDEDITNPEKQQLHDGSIVRKRRFPVGNFT